MSDALQVVTATLNRLVYTSHSKDGWLVIEVLKRCGDGGEWARDVVRLSPHETDVVVGLEHRAPPPVDDCALPCGCPDWGRHVVCYNSGACTTYLVAP